MGEEEFGKSPGPLVVISFVSINAALVAGILLGLADCIFNYKWLLSHNDPGNGLAIVAIVVLADLFETLIIVVAALAYVGLVRLLLGCLPKKIRHSTERFAVFAPVSIYLLLLGLALFSGKGLQRMGLVPFMQIGFWAAGSAIVWFWVFRFWNAARIMSPSLLRQGLFFLASFTAAFADAFLYRGLYMRVHLLIGLAAAASLVFALLPVVHHFGRRVASIRAVGLILVLLMPVAVVGNFLVSGDEGIQHSVIEESTFARYLVGEVLRRNRPVSEFPATMVSNHLDYERQDPAIEALRGAGSAERTPDILLVTVETTRFDHTTMGGYARNTTPELAAFARRSMLFTAAYAAFPSTEYSMISMMIGLPLNLSFRFSSRGNYWALPEMLGLAGYETACYFSFRRHFRQTPGALYYFDHLFGCGEIHENSLPADLLTDKLLSRVKDRGSRPLFIWAHYIDPHIPYNKHAEFDFGDKPMDRYDSEIAFTDANLGRLLRSIEKQERPWVIIVASDHGEEFGEHGHVGHSSALYEQQEHIIFLMRFPGASPGVYSEPVCLTDVMPTLLGYLGMEPPASSVGGDILGLVSKKFVRNSIVASLNNKVMVRDRQYKMIWNSNTGTRELYSMAADSSEFKNLVDYRPDVVVRMFKELRGWLDILKRKAALNRPSRQ
ncbi:MAG: sulfatase [Deltaproteobacteria bacterium]|nr:sulfatase [Deltaproteobacteria bacterium]